MKYQFMPMFWGDFFANTLHLTAQELGAYTALIGHAWEHDARIAVMDLQRVARINNRHWPKVRPRVEQFFDTSKVSNYWHHERVSWELAKAAEISNKRKDAAKQKHSKSSANGHANDPHLPSYLHRENLNLGKGSSNYRSPPRTKSTNVLEPIPEQPKRAADKNGEQR